MSCAILIKKHWFKFLHNQQKQHEANEYLVQDG